MYDDILIPTDGSGKEGPAIKHGFELAETYDATIHALCVVDISRGGAGLMSNMASTVSELRMRGGMATSIIAMRGEETGLTVKTEVREALPYEGILDYADEHDIDLLVMSSRGQSGVNRLVFGSVTERVTRLSGQPVLVVSRGTLENRTE